MEQPTGYRSDKPSADQDAVAITEDHPVQFSMWLSQYTYYYDEHVKGMVSLKVKKEDEIAERVRVHLRCVGHHLVLAENLTELYRDTQELLAYGEEVTHGAGTIEMRFSFTLPDYSQCFLPSFSLGSRKVMWFVYATVELASGAIYRTNLGQGHFRIGVVYQPMTAHHPRVFSKIKSLMRSAKQVQLSLDRPVFMASEPLKVKLSASVPSRELNGVKVHVVQDVQDVVHETFDITLCTNKNVAVVEDLSFRDQKITELAPTMVLHKDGVQYAKITYRVFLELTVGRMVRQYMVLHLPFTLTDLSPPPGMLTHIVQMDPPTEELPSYNQYATKSKTGRPHAVAPHMDKILASSYPTQRSGSGGSASSGGHLTSTAIANLAKRSPHMFRKASTTSHTSMASLHYDDNGSSFGESGENTEDETENLPTYNELMEGDSMSQLPVTQSASYPS